MGYEFEIYVWVSEGGALSRHYYQKVWEGRFYEEAIKMLNNVASQNKGKCVKLEWRPL